MKKYLLLITLFPAFAFAENSLFENHTWRVGDNFLKVTHHALTSAEISDAIGYRQSEYSLSYTLLNGMSSSTDFCVLTSPTSLGCIGGDAVVVDTDKNTATLTTGWNGPTIYYEEGMIPKTSALTGTWNFVSGSCNEAYINETQIVILYKENNNIPLENIHVYSRGGYAEETFKLVKCNDKLCYGPSWNAVEYPYWDMFYLYDADNNLINDETKIDTVAKLVEAHSHCTLVK